MPLLHELIHTLETLESRLHTHSSSSQKILLDANEFARFLHLLKQNLLTLHVFPHSSTNTPSVPSEPDSLSKNVNNDDPIDDSFFAKDVLELITALKNTKQI